MAEKIPSYNQTPKERFMSSGTNISAHHKLIEDPVFVKSVDAALLHYAEIIRRQISDPNKGMAVGYMISGAHDFVSVLKTLAEPVLSAPTPKSFPHLDENADARRQ